MKEKEEVKKGTNGAPFSQLKSHIEFLLRIQESNIAHLAIANPNNLSNNLHFRSCVEQFTVLDALLDKADQIETESIA